MSQSAVDLQNQGHAGRAQRYTTTAILLHWVIALLLFGQIAFGWFLETIPRGIPARGFYVNLHKSTGLTLSLLMIARLAWRIANPPPELPSFLPSWERRAAKWSHRGLAAPRSA